MSVTTFVIGADASLVNSHSKKTIYKWHFTPRVYSFPLILIRYDWKSCTVSPASPPLMRCERCGCLNFMALKGEHTQFSPGAHTWFLLSILLPIWLLQVQASSPSAWWEMSLCPHTFYGIRSQVFTLLWWSLRDVQKTSSLPLPSWISSAVAEMRTRGFPMSRRRDTDHSRLSPLPRPTENNHRRLDWPIIQQVEKSARKAAWGDDPVKANLQRVLWGTVYG